MANLCLCCSGVCFGVVDLDVLLQRELVEVDYFTRPTEQSHFDRADCDLALDESPRSAKSDNREDLNTKREIFQ